jgi:DNA invertase Pin-like site-specific DNA recombinase/DNA-binding transcriptional ArsR family regulator
MPETSLHAPGKKRIAAYCRVSTNNNNQDDSLESQKQYFLNEVKRHPEWELAGIYADLAKTGTQNKGRTDFQRMMRHAEEHKFDYIITKSISRFSRNVSDTMRCLEKLHDLGIGVYFLEQGYDTEEQGSQISEIQKWVYRYRAEHGIFRARRGMYFGYNTDNGKFIPDENAGIVRSMFKMFAAGKELNVISDIVNSYGVLTTKRKPFTSASVKSILKNEVYVGDIHIGKTPSRNVITKKIDENYYDKYVEYHHEGIVDRELWEAVQKIFDGRKIDRETCRLRKKKILAVLRNEPGLTRAEIAARSQVSLEDVGHHLNRMKEKGLVRNVGHKWELTETSPR